MPELFASLNFSANSYFPSFISISNLQVKRGHVRSSAVMQVKDGLGASKVCQLCSIRRHLEIVSLHDHHATATGGEPAI